MTCLYRESFSAGGMIDFDVSFRGDGLYYQNMMNLLEAGSRMIQEEVSAVAKETEGTLLRRGSVLLL